MLRGVTKGESVRGLCAALCREEGSAILYSSTSRHLLQLREGDSESVFYDAIICTTDTKTNDLDRLKVLTDRGTGGELWETLSS